MQPIQVKIGSRKIIMHPSKGSWKTHEWFSKKILFAAKNLMVEYFLENNEGDPVKKIIERPEEGMWEMQRDYEVFYKSMETCKCEITRCAVLYAKLTDHWLACHNGVRVGCFNVLEVEGCDWLSIWVACKKPQYALETKRRMEVLYQMDPTIREYIRQNSFFCGRRMATSCHSTIFAKSTIRPPRHALRILASTWCAPEVSTCTSCNNAPKSFLGQRNSLRRTSLISAKT